MKIFLDDERNPVDPTWVVVRNFGEFHRLFLQAGETVTALSLDHDLGWQQRSGKDCVNWLIDLALDEPDMVKGLELIIFHTANYEGLKDMLKTIANAIEHNVLPDIELREYSCLFHSDHAIMPDHISRE